VRNDESETREDIDYRIAVGVLGCGGLVPVDSGILNKRAPSPHTSKLKSVKIGICSLVMKRKYNQCVRTNLQYFIYCGGSKSSPSTSRWKASFLE
jgi:hypothetical protein